MKFLIHWAAGVLTCLILVAWALVDQAIHDRPIKDVLAPWWAWLGGCLAVGALIGYRRSRPDRVSTGCVHLVFFVLLVVPFTLLLGFIREVFGTRSAPEGFWVKTAHIVLHAVFFSAAAFLVSRPRRSGAP